MYYQEKVISGLIYFRTSPHSKWEISNKNTVSDVISSLKKDFLDIINENKALKESRDQYKTIANDNYGVGQGLVEQKGVMSQTIKDLKKEISVLRDTISEGTYENEDLKAQIKDLERHIDNSDKISQYNYKLADATMSTNDKLKKENKRLTEELSVARVELEDNAPLTVNIHHFTPTATFVVV